MAKSRRRRLGIGAAVGIVLLGFGLTQTTYGQYLVQLATIQTLDRGDFGTSGFQVLGSGKDQLVCLVTHSPRLDNSKAKLTCTTPDGKRLVAPDRSLLSGRNLLDLPYGFPPGFPFVDVEIRAEGHRTSKWRISHLPVGFHDLAPPLAEVGKPMTLEARAVRGESGKTTDTVYFGVRPSQELDPHLKWIARTTIDPPYRGTNQYIGSGTTEVGPAAHKGQWFGFSYSSPIVRYLNDFPVQMDLVGQLTKTETVDAGWIKELENDKGTLPKPVVFTTPSGFKGKLTFLQFTKDANFKDQLAVFYVIDCEPKTLPSGFGTESLGSGQPVIVSGSVADSDGKHAVSFTDREVADPATARDFNQAIQSWVPRAPARRRHMVLTITRTLIVRRSSVRKWVPVTGTFSPAVPDRWSQYKGTQVQAPAGWRD